MVSAFIFLVFLSTSSSAGALHAELRVGADVKPMKDVHVVYPDTLQGHRDEAFYKAHAGKNDVPSLFFGKGYAVGRIPNGFAIKTQIGGDRIVAIPVLATLRDKDLTLSYGVCSFPKSRWLVNGYLGLSVVQWLIHDIPWADYKVTFKGTDLGNC